MAKVKSVARVAAVAAFRVATHDKVVINAERTIAITVALAVARALGLVH